MTQAQQRKRPAAKPGAKAARGQTGGTIIGFIAGVVVGLVAALAMAVYVTKVPVPFMSGKTPSGRPVDDDAEARKNQNWDPNAPLHGRNPARPSAPSTAPASAPATAPVPPPAVAVPAPATTPRVDSPAPSATARPAAPSADPLGDLARARSGGSPAPAAAPAATADPFDYFVQAGAFRTADDAEAQRARLAMMGLEARVTEREQAGRTVYRVRMGPYHSRDDAERTKARLDSTGADSALVRVQR
jgi:cell division protein FtsN